LWLLSIFLSIFLSCRMFGCFMVINRDISYWLWTHVLCLVLPYCLFCCAAKYSGTKVHWQLVCIFICVTH